MNREQIIKALECCSCINDELTCGYDCYLYGGTFCQLILKKDVYSLVKELIEENERLRADTVRKMHNRVLQLFPCDKKFTTISRFTIDQIEKEMLEGK